MKQNSKMRKETYMIAHFSVYNYKVIEPQLLVNITQTKIRSFYFIKFLLNNILGHYKEKKKKKRCLSNKVKKKKKAIHSPKVPIMVYNFVIC